MADPHLADKYYLRLAAAFVRGRAIQGDLVALPDRLRDAALDDLTESDFAAIFTLGTAAGLKLHKFKRTMGLPRVERVLGILRAVAPADVLDVGTGRGAFLWPLLAGFPGLPVTAIDPDPQRAGDIEAVRLGGIAHLAGAAMDAAAMDFADRMFDVTTLLEVLEHIPDVGRAVAEAIRVTRRFVVVSVPSKADDNPKHLRLLTQPALLGLFSQAGVRRVNFEHVPGHLMAVASTAP